MSESIEEKYQKIHESLRSQGYRITRQKKLVISTILMYPESNCKELCILAGKIDENISLATVYRTVKQLEDLGYLKSRLISIS